MHSLSDTNPFLETVKDGVQGGGYGPVGGIGIVVHVLCQQVRF